MEQLAAQVGEMLTSRGFSLATAESCTGGGVAQAITDIPGSSGWFERGFVTYANQAKVEMLGVREETLRAHGAVSELAVREMAEGALHHSHADLALAVSGIAGPGGGTPDKPVGTVWFAWAARSGATVAGRYLLDGDRAEIRARSVRIALQGVLDFAAGLPVVA
ncbi:MAG TPA: nicotinamide-nucleotide amidohydrolase family protein [Gallionellaceae bacterium]|nr:nicotinamide-nucleotide amidohydrolase family protein [Gallionellaceae bacterium]